MLVLLCVCGVCVQSMEIQIPPSPVSEDPTGMYSEVPPTPCTDKSILRGNYSKEKKEYEKFMIL